MVWRVCVQKLPWLFFAAWVSLKWFNRHGIQHSTVVGALAAHSIPASLYAKNNASLLNAQLLTALRKAKVDLVPSHLAEACAAQAVPSFNDLILARMANDRRPVLAALTDKALMRTWASHRNVSTPEQLLVSQTCNADLFADRLRGVADYGFKATHTTGCLVLVERGRIAGHKPCGESRLPPGTRATPEILLDLCTRWTRTMYDVTQWAYSKLEPGVLAERLVYAGPRRRKADDVKCYAFHGKTALVHHVSDRFDADTGRPKSSAKRDTFYDPVTGLLREGVSMDGNRPLSRRSKKLLSPAKVKSAANVCDNLARGLDFARVDLFDDGDTFLAGELTMYPKRGGHAFKPAAVDAELGRAWCRIPATNATR